VRITARGRRVVATARVVRLPQFQVAIYRLLMPFILANGFQRTVAYLPLPLWRRKSIRPSILDLLNPTGISAGSRPPLPKPLSSGP
jgi:hypothetical protein